MEINKTTDDSTHSMRPALLGISLGNPYYYKEENLYQLFKYADQQSPLVKLFVPGVINIHSYRAAHYSKPERDSRTETNYVRNKCKRVLTNNPELQASKFTFTDWRKKVEEAESYLQQLSYMRDLFENKPDFRKDVLELTTAALTSLSYRRKHGGKKSDTPSEKHDGENCQNGPEDMDPPGEAKQASEAEGSFDVIEGSKYLLKEIAFFMAVPDIYEGYEQYDFIYHRDMPTIERFIEGHYDGIPKSFMKFVTCQPDN